MCNCADGNHASGSQQKYIEQAGSVRINSCSTNILCQLKSTFRFVYYQPKTRFPPLGCAAHVPLKSLINSHGDQISYPLLSLAARLFAPIEAVKNRFIASLSLFKSQNTTLTNQLGTS